MLRKLLRALGCLAYLGGLGVMFALVAYAAFSAFVRGGVTSTPELFGLSQEEAIALLADAGLRVTWSEDGEIYDENVPKGHIVRQDPGAGVYVKRSREVTLTVSLGPRRIAVPEVRGEALQSAQVALGAIGLKTGQVLNVLSEDAPGGAVVAVQPATGERVQMGAAINFLVSNGTVGEVYVMPDLVKLNYEGVRNFFETRGFRLGRVSYESYDGVAPGTVLRQFPLAGHQLRKTDVISLDVVTPLGVEPSRGTSPRPPLPGDGRDTDPR
jgi:eukaryotic-like serine/threonine-protein kinase